MNGDRRFRRLRLKNWKNFAGVEVELQNRVFLVGPNAAGKSNFLDAIRFLRDVASSGGGFQEAVGRRGGVSALRCQADPELLTQTHLEQVNVNRPFRELVEFFASVRYLHIVPQLHEIKLEPDAGGTPHLRGKYQHWRGQGAWQTEEQFSDGTLRLMGLLWVAMEKQGPLLLFPENEGTTVTTAGSLTEVRDLLEGGLSLADVVVPRTRPPQATRLPLFGSKTSSHDRPGRVPPSLDRPPPRPANGAQFVPACGRGENASVRARS